MPESKFKEYTLVSFGNLDLYRSFEIFVRLFLNKVDGKSQSLKMQLCF